MADPLDPSTHGRPVWFVWKLQGQIGILLAKLHAYDEHHRMLQPGSVGRSVCIWGYSIYRKKPGFRTLGIPVERWSERFDLPPVMFLDQEEALALLRKWTTPRA